MMQSWRIIGFAFPPLYAYEVLPGLFAWPAGLGDVARGLSAPLVTWTLPRHPDFAASRGFIVWNLLGLLDFAVAGVTSTLASGAVAGLVSGPATAAPGAVRAARANRPGLRATAGLRRGFPGACLSSNMGAGLVPPHRIAPADGPLLPSIRLNSAFSKLI